MDINVKETFLIFIDKDLKRRESLPATNVERLKTLDINDVALLLKQTHKQTRAGI